MEKDLMINSDAVRLLRKNKGWSQEQLARASGLSLRTIQRVEAEGKASLETKVCLAATLETNLDKLDSPSASSNSKKIKNTKAFFYSVLFTMFLSIIGFLTKSTNPLFFLANLISIFGIVYIALNWYFAPSFVENDSRRSLARASFIYVGLFSVFSVAGGFGATVVPAMLISLLLFSSVFYLVIWTQKDRDKQQVKPGS
ncbi:hypothetical protein AWH61_13330 [Alteromonas sp. W12]|uniref:helix-turn-helix domain-containing protein n=1 Tax=Alteromonas sp. W12 TaxID=1772289 RepID=UPI000948B3C0|nr:helix-turn-helix transcriptional regulator [Alteromonas sp. W12]OLF74198.1 hypothetical protein AWH61_13330 [Alteromonas sp. W12]